MKLLIKKLCSATLLKYIELLEKENQALERDNNLIHQRHKELIAENTRLKKSVDRLISENASLRLQIDFPSIFNDGSCPTVKR